MDESKPQPNDDAKNTPEKSQSSPEENLKPHEVEEIDNRSIFVGNVDFSTSTEELRDVFKGCGNIERVTIPIDKFSQIPKGYAYIEFSDQSGVLKAQSLNEKSFKGRKLKVMPKRTNLPGHNKSRPRFRGSFRGSFAYGRSRYSRFRPYY
ncbi:unnamed protein product [Blepharisma stoltei]|uniref:RRM domain-containing protein n=1 Tax=Blepharisma stoltei TaxID=1481888 RepID=A0AAU9IQ43_9CILI|nr:unnamed protein product [Blepharisma stoltei]